MADYKYWESVLAGKPLPVHEDSPQPGFWRKRTGKAKGYIPVALWEQDGKMVALVDGVAADPGEIWTYVADKPVTEEHYRERVSTGRWWDEDPAAIASLAVEKAGFKPFRDTGYLVSRSGQVMSPKDRILSPRVHTNGYLRVELGRAGGDEYVHRMVAIVFHGEPAEGQEVDHINNNRADNRAENLRWVTRSENLEDRDLAIGEDHGGAKITEAHVRLIRTGPFYRGRDKDLAESMGISVSQVCDIRNGKYWKHVQPVPGGNEPSDEADILKDQITSALAGVDAYAEVKDDATAAKAQSLRSRLLELSGEADKAREKLVRPHLDAQNAVNADYMPLVKGAKAGADTIRKALSEHETRKDQEAKAKASAEAEKLAKETFKHAPLGTEPPKPEPVPVAAPAPLKGAYGRAATVKIVKKATITDLQAVFVFFQAQPDVTEFLAKKAQKAVDAGFVVPGTDVVEERDVR